MLALHENLTGEGKAGKEKGPSCQKSELGWLLRDELVQLCCGKSRRALTAVLLALWAHGLCPWVRCRGRGSLCGLGLPFSAVGTGKGCNGKSGSGAKTGRAKIWPRALAEPKPLP